MTSIVAGVAWKASALTGPHLSFGKCWKMRALTSRIGSLARLSLTRTLKADLRERWANT
jgi:hypothetical protein